METAIVTICAILYFGSMGAMFIILGAMLGEIK